MPARSRVWNESGPKTRFSRSCAAGVSTPRFWYAAAFVPRMHRQGLFQGSMGLGSQDPVTGGHSRREGALPPRRGGSAGHPDKTPAVPGGRARQVPYPLALPVPAIRSGRRGKPSGLIQRRKNRCHKTASSAHILLKRPVTCLNLSCARPHGIHKENGDGKHDRIIPH